MLRSFAVIAVVFISLGNGASVLFAQFFPGYPNPYYPGFGFGSNQGNWIAPNYLYGAADLARANADATVSTEKARLLREQYNQAKIETQKKAFDQMLYEQANTPTYTEIVQGEQALILTRMLNSPTPGEIANATALNTILPYVQSISGYGTQGPPIPIPRSAVDELNVSPSGTSSVGMLRDGGQVPWPVALRGPYQRRLDPLFEAAYRATLNGTLDNKLLREIRTEMNAMRDNLRLQLKNEEIDTSTWITGIEFFHALENTVNALARPDARKQLNGTFEARGRNVQELVDYMTDHGLKFAPATPGHENAYRAVHNALVRYARAASGSGNAQVSSRMIGPPPTRER
jgi:hypothetical protein